MEPNYLLGDILAGFFFLTWQDDFKMIMEEQGLGNSHDTPKEQDQGIRYQIAVLLGSDICEDNPESTGMETKGSVDQNGEPRNESVKPWLLVEAAACAGQWGESGASVTCSGRKG